MACVYFFLQRGWFSIPADRTGYQQAVAAVIEGVVGKGSKGMPSIGKNIMTIKQLGLFLMGLISFSTNAEQITYPEFFTNEVGIVFRLVLPGSFTMGCEEHSVTAPSHQVTISKPLYLSTTEVTQAQYTKVMGENPSYHKGIPERPVEQVNHEDAVKFCKQLGKKDGHTYRLPTEAEWEYAARAGGDFRGHDDLAEQAWTVENSDGRTHVVAQRAPNPWGFYDLAGNVWEWVFDNVSSYPSNSVTDPVNQAWKGKVKDEQGIIRGGSWDLPIERSHPCNRVHVHRKSIWAPFIGFRVVRTLERGGSLDE